MKSRVPGYATEGGKLVIDHENARLSTQIDPPDFRWSLGNYLSQVPLNYSYRFLFIPGTIGSITWLSLNQKGASKIKHGLVVACVGDAGHFTYKKTRRGNAEIDRAAAHALKTAAMPFRVVDFFPYVLGLLKRNTGS